MLNFMKSRVVGPVKHPTGMRFRDMYIILRMPGVPGHQWGDPVGESRNHKRSHEAQFHMDPCPFPIFNDITIVDQLLECANRVEKTIAAESEEFSLMTSRGKGLLNKPRGSSGKTDPKETRFPFHLVSLISQ